MLINKLFFGVRGSSNLYDDAVRYSYMITEKAKEKILDVKRKKSGSPMFPSFAITAIILPFAPLKNRNRRFQKEYDENAEDLMRQILSPQWRFFYLSTDEVLTFLKYS